MGAKNVPFMVSVNLTRELMIILIIFTFLAGIVTVLSPFTLKAITVLPEKLKKEEAAPLGILIGWIISFIFFSTLFFVFIQQFGFSPAVFQYSALLFMGFFGLVFILPTFSLLFARLIFAFGNWKITQHSGLFGSFILGALLGLVWTPIAGLLIGASAALAAKHTLFHATLLAIIYASGAGLALFDLVRKKGILMPFAPHGRLLSQGLGFSMLGTALLLVFGGKGIFERGLLKELPNIQIQNPAWVENQLKPLEPVRQPFINQDFDPFSRPAPIPSGELEATPEIFLGYDGANAYVPTLQLIPDSPANYDAIGSLGYNQASLQGKWEVFSDHILSLADDAVIKVNYKGSIVYMVLGGESPVPLGLVLDGTALPEQENLIVNEQGGLFIKEKRLYQIITIPGGGRHELALTIPKGIKAYAFIFASE